VLVTPPLNGVLLNLFSGLFQSKSSPSSRQEHSTSRGKYPS